MADLVEHNRKPTGQKVPGVAPTRKPAPPPPPWISRHWFGPITAKRGDECLICGMPVEAGDTIIFRHGKGQVSFVMCSMCASSISELEIHAVTHQRGTD